MEIIKSFAALLALSTIGIRPSPELETNAVDMLARVIDTILTLFV